MSQDLLLRVDLDIPSGRVPLMGEFPINRELTPVLVTSATGTLWMPKLTKDVVRAAFREQGAGDYFQSVVRETISRASKKQWSNLFPYSPSGLEEAIDYLSSNGLDEIEVLIPEGNHEGVDVNGATITEVSWLPQGISLVVPSDRQYLGWYSCVGRDGKFLVSVVHNPLLGMAVLVDGLDAEGDKLPDIDW
ncbi:MAG: hypothetical protein LAT68_16140 [Cyclobacteriaceae bacterium]|nr:hypothetical protein [Cyclobacteriaceae bacterium]